MSEVALAAVAEGSKASYLAQTRAKRSLPFLSLFSGIGGMDAGLVAAGGTIVEFCESWEPARRVLREFEPGVPLGRDVRDFVPTQHHRLIAAGFPCVDLSHAGKQAGIFGEHSGLVSEVFRIAKVSRPDWIMLENVPNLLRLGRGAGIQLITQQLETLGYHWAYRVLDSRAFGVAQRRHRVVVLASATAGAAAAALLGDDTRAVEKFAEPNHAAASGFYWTEGRRGVGLVRDAVPTLKGGSTLGLPSAPAVWRPHAPVGARIVLPSIGDAEALQGFPRGWTAVADREHEPSNRWKLVGNAVTVGLATWVGGRIVAFEGDELRTVAVSGRIRDTARPWPDASHGGPGMSSHAVEASKWPVDPAPASLDDALDIEQLRPLSYRATKGFLSRVEESGIKLDEQFVEDLEGHMAAMRTPVKQAASQDAKLSDPVKRRGRVLSELDLRRALTDRGLRYTLQSRPERDLPWRLDFVFKGAKVVVDIRNCLRHMCAEHDVDPPASDSRESKRKATRAREARMATELAERGWLVLVVWEHEDVNDVSAGIELAVRGDREDRRRSGVSLARLTSM